MSKYFHDRIAKSDGYTPGFQPQQKDVVKLNTNENPYPPSEQVLKALDGIEPEHLRKYPDPKAMLFRTAAAEVHGVTPDNIMCCRGGDDLLAMAMRVFCDENRPVAYPVPTYSLYKVLAGFQNCPVIELPYDENFELPMELADTGAALTIVCNPNSPTGTWSRIDQLSELAGKLSGILLIDEAYVDFASEDAVALVHEFDNVIILRSLSKGYSLAGLRFGYAIAHPDLVAGFMKIKDSYHIDAISLALASAAVRDQDYFKQTILKINDHRQELVEQLEALGFTVPKSSTNFVLAEHKTKSAEEIEKQLVERNIYVRRFNHPGLDNKLRISVGTPEQNSILIKALKEITAN